MLYAGFSYITQMAYTAERKRWEPVVSPKYADSC